jgi:hypothetical protein
MSIPIVKIILMLILSLSISLVREKIRFLKFSPGDSKMATVVSLLLLNVIQIKPICLVIVIHALLFFVSFILMSLSIVFLLIKKVSKGISHFKVGGYFVNIDFERKRIIYSEPASLSIAVTVLILLSLKL